MPAAHVEGRPESGQASGFVGNGFDGKVFDSEGGGFPFKPWKLRCELAEAVVDCFVREPLPPDHLFFDVPNLILTPHMSGVYGGFWPLMFTLIGENLHRLKSGQPLLNLTSRSHGY